MDSGPSFIITTYYYDYDYFTLMLFNVGPTLTSIFLPGIEKRQSLFPIFSLQM